MMTKQEIAEFEAWAKANPDDPLLAEMTQCAELFFAALVQARSRLSDDLD